MWTKRNNAVRSNFGVAPGTCAHAVAVRIKSQKKEKCFANGSTKRKKTMHGAISGVALLEKYWK